MKLKPVWFLFATILAVAIIVLTTKFRRQRAESESVASANMPAANVPAPDYAVAPISVPASAWGSAPISVPSSDPAMPLANGAAVAPSPATPAQLVAELQQIGPVAPGVPISPEQADKFKQNVAELVRQGAVSVSAIREFLDKNIDVHFSDFGGGELLGYSSLRASLFDALSQIGGPDAQAAMVQALKTTAVPAEILELAKNLEGQAPGQYSDEIVNAAREAVEMSAANQLGSNVEVGPAFRILQTYGAYHPGALDDQKSLAPKDSQ